MTVYYVSNDGDDTANGTSSLTPWARAPSMPDASDTADGLDGSLAAGDTILFNRGDIWHQKLTPASSGVSGSPITYGAYGSGNDPIISGGQDITETWVAGPTGTQKKKDMSTSRFRMLWVNGKRAVRARLPIRGMYDYSIDGDVSDVLNQFKFEDAECDSTWTDLANVEIVSYRRWEQTRYKVSSVDDGTEIITMADDRLSGRGYDTDYDPTAGRYWVDNVYEGIIQGGWYLNDTDDFVYYRFRDGETMGTTEAIASKETQVVTVTGRDFITFEDLTFAYSDWELGDDGWPGNEPWDQTSLMKFTYSHDCIVKDCVFKETGNAAVYGQGVERLTVTGCTMHDLGAAGIYIAAEYAHPSVDCIITNNTIYDGGLVIKTTPAIRYGGNGGIITGNTVYNFPYIGIQVSPWRKHTEYVGYKPTPNIVQNNIVHDVMQELNDGGGIYCAGYQKDSDISNNLVYNVVFTDLHIKKGEGTIYGLYYDVGMTGSKLHHNVVYNCDTAILMHDITNTQIYNNTFISSVYWELVFSGFGVDSYDADFPGSTFYNNIIYSTGATTKLFTVSEDATRGNPIIAADYNCYFTTQSDNSNWNLEEDWQDKYGYDSNAIEADPQFEDSDNNNYQLQDNSPCINTGTIIGTGDETDFLGNSVVGLTDIGAYEYQGWTDLILLDIYNLALAKFSGAGDQTSGSGLITSTTKGGIEELLNLHYPRVRRKVINDLANLKSPFKEALKFFDLGSESGLDVETGGWDYAFALPTEVLSVFRQLAQSFVTTQTSITDKLREYRFDTLLHGTTKLLLTNDLTNDDRDSAFVQYVYDQKETATFSEGLIECIVTLLASKLAPTVGPKGTTRKELLAEYEAISIPEAAAYNQMQFSKTRVIPNLKAGRSEFLPGV